MTRENEASIRDLQQLSRILLNQSIHLHGAERAIEAMQPGMIARATSCGVSYAELKRIFRRMESFADWPEAWCASADSLATQGKGALETQDVRTALDFLTRASAHYFYGQLFLDLGTARKQAIVDRMIECYELAGAHLDPPVLRVGLPFNGTRMPGYLRIPRTNGKVPCVVMLGGADTVKEELHWWAEHFVNRGLAALYFDGPGQGETYPELKMTDRYEEAASAALDWLSTQTELDASRVVIWGISLGGYLAARALATDHRWSAGVNVGGFYDARGFPVRALHGQERWRQMFGMTDIAAIRSHVAQHVTLKGLLASLDRPLLVVHSGRDVLVPVEEIDCFAEESPTMVELWMYKEAVHALWDVYEEVAPKTADWVRKQLNVSEPEVRK